MLLIILIGAALSYEPPEPAHLTAGACVDTPRLMPWRWRCITGVAARSGAGFPAKKPPIRTTSVEIERPRKSGPFTSPPFAWPRIAASRMQAFPIHAAARISL